MRDLTRIELSPAEIDTILAEALRRELVQVFGRQDTAHTRSDTEIDARIAALEAEVTALRRAARRNDVALVDDWCREAADTVSVTIPRDLPPALGRKALHLKADIATLACEEFGIADELRIIGYRDLQSVIEADRKDDELYLRVMRPKDRAPWTPDRIRQLLTSPIYAGCASTYWRWRPGDMIIRDATYWVPLLILTMALRVTEAVQLKRSKLVRHDGVLCLAIGEDLDQRIKNDPSCRYVPIPRSFSIWASWSGSAPCPRLMAASCSRRRLTGARSPTRPAPSAAICGISLPGSTSRTSTKTSTRSARP
jgi:hypothetical protein